MNSRLSGITFAVLLVVSVFAAGSAATTLDGAGTATEQLDQANSAEVANTQSTDDNTTQSPTDDSEPTVREIVQNAQQSYASIHSLEATVSVTTTAGGNETHAVADAYYTQSGEFGLLFKEPAEAAGDAVVVNDTTTRVYDEDKNTTYVLDNGTQGATPGTVSPDAVLTLLQKGDVTFDGTATVNGEETYVLTTTEQEQVTRNGQTVTVTTTTKTYLDTESYLPVKVVSESTVGEQVVGTTVVSVNYTEINSVECPPKEPVGFEFPESAQTVQVDDPSVLNETVVGTGA